MADNRVREGGASSNTTKREGGPPSKISQQIESSADYYSPGLYAFGNKATFFGTPGGPDETASSNVEGLLTYYRDLTIHPDPVSQQYIPLSSVPQRSRNTKTFAIGVLPPAQNITGRLLDRSRNSLFTKHAVTSFPEEDTYVAKSAAGGIVTAPGYQVEQGTGDFRNAPYPSGNSAALCTRGELAWSKVKGPDGKFKHVQKEGVDAQGNQVSNCTRSYSSAQLYRVLGEAYVRVHGRDPTPTELQFYTAQALRETSGNLVSNNFGQIGNFSSPRDNTYAVKYTVGNRDVTAYFNSYSTIESGADSYIRLITTRNPNVVTAAQSGDALGYMTSLAQQGYFQEPVKKYYENFPRILNRVAQGTRTHGIQLASGSGLPPEPPDVPSMTEDIFAYRKRTAQQEGAASFRFNEDSPYSPGDLPSTDQPAGASESWAGNGQKASQEASKTRGIVSDTDVEFEQRGDALRANQKAQIRAAQAALESMKKTPPLRMLVNPSKFAVKSEKIVADGNWTRTGPIIEFWGDNQDKISGSGQVAAFYALDAFPRTTQGGPGLTRHARNFSQAWQNFQSLYLLYRNNGAMYLQDMSQQELDTNLSTVGSIYIFYDNILYIGSFDSFNVTEADTKPFSVEYSFEFTVRAAFLLEAPTEFNFRGLTPRDSSDLQSNQELG